MCVVHSDSPGSRVARRKGCHIFQNLKSHAKTSMAPEDKEGPGHIPLVEGHSLIGLVTVPDARGEQRCFDRNWIAFWWLLSVQERVYSFPLLLSLSPFVYIHLCREDILHTYACMRERNGDHVYTYMRIYVNKNTPV